jgi:hypothetical protein
MTNPGMNDMILSKVSSKNLTKKVKSKDSKKSTAKDIKEL